MIVGVVTNAERDAGLEYTRNVCEFLTRNGCVVTAGFPSELPRDAGFWVVLGGDGTMLRTAHFAAEKNTPLLGINLGNLGYLTDVEKHDGFKAIESVLKGNFNKENRLMLEICENENIMELPLHDKIALNDVYLSRGGSGKLVTFNLYINGNYMDTLRADGVIIATPTGSTAYNLSAGGPILMPDGDMMVVTPVCPHSLHTRSLVIAAGNTVRVDSSANSHLDVVVDGEARFSLAADTGITVKPSKYTASVIKTSSAHFYEILRRKINI